MSFLMPGALKVQFAIALAFVGLLWYWVRRNRSGLRHGPFGDIPAPARQTAWPASDIVSLAGSLLSLNRALEEAISPKGPSAPANAPNKQE